MSDIHVGIEAIPPDLFVTVREAYIALRQTKVKKEPGPGGLPNIVLKEFASELAPLIADVYNTSLREGVVPPSLKHAIVFPLPKEMPPKSVENDIRPISLTNQVAKITEGFTLTRSLPGIYEDLDCKQFAAVGMSIQHAIAYVIHLVLEALDSGSCSARLFFADFRKGFDLIDHTILLSKLHSFNLHPCLVRWIAAFLEGRSQSVRIGSDFSNIRSLNGGIPQGTKLGPVLFSVMVNDLVNTWSKRAKYVDDLTILEIIPRNSPSYLNCIVDDIQCFSHCNNMRLNPAKYKAMTIGFLDYNLSCTWRPICTSGDAIERVKSFKLLGVYISEDLTWGVHCDYIVKKANRRLYALRSLKKCGVPTCDLITVYCSFIRSVIEYASAVFANLPKYLSDALEGIKKRALRIIFSNLHYDEALTLSGLSSLEDRRTAACESFILIQFNPVYGLAMSRRITTVHSYSLRSCRNYNDKRCNTKRLLEFLSVKYLDFLS